MFVSETVLCTESFIGEGGGGAGDKEGISHQANSGNAAISSLGQGQQSVLSQRHVCQACCNNIRSGQVYRLLHNT